MTSQSLSDEELRADLIALGVNVGPITATTRDFYEKQLEKKRLNKSSGSPNRSSKESAQVDIPRICLLRCIRIVANQSFEFQVQEDWFSTTPRFQESSSSRSFNEQNAVLEGPYSGTSNCTAEFYYFVIRHIVQRNVCFFEHCSIFSKHQSTN